MNIRNYKNNASLLADARRSLLGHLSVAVSGFLLYSVIGLFLNGLPQSLSFQNPVLNLVIMLAAQFITAVFGSLFGVGLSCIFLNLQYGQEPHISDLFVCLRNNQDTAVRVRSVVTGGELAAVLPIQLLMYFLPQGRTLSYIPVITVVTVVCLAAMFAWRFTFAMADFLLLDFPEMDAGRILRAAKSMMRGSRVRYLRLMLRLLPLHLLTVFSFGLTAMWTGSYQRAAAAAFYRDLLESTARVPAA